MSKSVNSKTVHQKSWIEYKWKSLMWQSIKYSSMKYKYPSEVKVTGCVKRGSMLYVLGHWVQKQPIQLNVFPRGFKIEMILFSGNKLR